MMPQRVTFFCRGVRDRRCGSRSRRGSSSARQPGRERSPCAGGCLHLEAGSPSVQSWHLRLRSDRSAERGVSVLDPLGRAPL